MDVAALGANCLTVGVQLCAFMYARVCVCLC